MTTTQSSFGSTSPSTLGSATPSSSKFVFNIRKKLPVPETCIHPSDKRCPLCSNKPTDKYKCYKHGIRKYECIECHGSARCRHGRLSHRCKLCKEFISIE